MATKRRDLQDDEIIRFLRFSVTETAPATFTEQSYDTNLSIDIGMLWMIHWIEWDINLNDLDECAAGTVETISGQITREPKSGLLYLNDTDLIARKTVMVQRSAAIGTDAGPMWNHDEHPKLQKFPIPLPYAAQTVYIGLIASAAGVQNVNGRIAYTLRRVSDKFFVRVAHALLS